MSNENDRRWLQHMKRIVEDAQNNEGVTRLLRDFTRLPYIADTFTNDERVEHRLEPKERLRFELDNLQLIATQRCAAALERCAAALESKAYDGDDEG